MCLFLFYFSCCANPSSVVDRMWQGNCCSKTGRTLRFHIYFVFANLFTKYYIHIYTPAVPLLAATEHAHTHRVLVYGLQHVIITFRINGVTPFCSLSKSEGRKKKQKLRRREANEWCRDKDQFRTALLPIHLVHSYYCCLSIYLLLLHLTSNAVSKRDEELVDWKVERIGIRA